MTLPVTTGKHLLMTEVPEEPTQQDSDSSQQPPPSESRFLAGIRREPLAFAAWATAVAALTVAVWQGMETRNYYRVSIAPIVNFYWTSQQYRDVIGLEVENKGQGTARIQNVSIRVDDKDKLYSTWQPVISALGIDNSTNWIQYLDYASGAALAPGRREILFGLRSDEAPASQRQTITDALPRLKVELEYCSLYEDCEFAKYPPKSD